MQYFLSTSGGTSTDFILACFRGVGGWGGRVGPSVSIFGFVWDNFVGLGVELCVCGKGIWLIHTPPKTYRILLNKTYTNTYQEVVVAVREEVVGLEERRGVAALHVQERVLPACVAVWWSVDIWGGGLVSQSAYQSVRRLRNHRRPHPPHHPM